MSSRVLERKTIRELSVSKDRIGASIYLHYSALPHSGAPYPNVTEIKLSLEEALWLIGEIQGALKEETAPKASPQGNSGRTTP